MVADGLQRARGRTNGSGGKGVRRHRTTEKDKSDGDILRAQPRIHRGRRRSVGRVRLGSGPALEKRIGNR